MRLCLTLVLATPISGPALMWTPQWDSLLMVEPTVLVTPTCTVQYSTAQYSTVLYTHHQCALVPAVAQRRQRVRGLPGLRDEEAGVVPEDEDLKRVKKLRY